MPLKQKHLNAAKTYIILDTQVSPYSKLLSILKSIVSVPVDVVQVRDKNGSAKDMLDFCYEVKKMTGEKTLFIVNDRVDIALVVGADGIHVGQEDMPFEEVKRLVKNTMLIGISCQSLDHAKQAQKRGAHYIGFGSIFKTKTKPFRVPIQLKLLQKVHKTIKIPIFPIGGINRDNIKILLNYGIERVAVCRDVIEDRHPRQVVQEYKQVLEFLKK